MRIKHRVAIAAGIILGLIFVVAGVSKLLHQPEAIRIFFIPLPYFITQTMAKALLYWLPRVEVIIGLLLITGIGAKVVAIFSSALIAGFITHNSVLISRGFWSEPCDCFGKLKVVPYTEISVLGSLGLDIAMLGLVLIILVWYGGNFFNIYPWFSVKGEIKK